MDTDMIAARKLPSNRSVVAADNAADCDCNAADSYPDPSSGSIDNHTGRNDSNDGEDSDEEHGTEPQSKEARPANDADKLRRPTVLGLGATTFRSLPCAADFKLRCLTVGQSHCSTLLCTVGATGSRWVAQDEVLRATKAAESKSSLRRK